MIVSTLQIEVMCYNIKYQHNIFQMLDLVRFNLSKGMIRTEMDIILSKKPDKMKEKVQKNQKKRISIPLKLFEQLKTEADKRKIAIPEFLGLLLDDFLKRNQNEQKQTDEDIQNNNTLQDSSEYNKQGKNVVRLETVFSENIENDQARKKVSEKSSIGIIDIEKRLLDKARDELEVALGTPDEERCKQEYRRLLREQKRKEYNYNGK